MNRRGYFYADALVGLFLLAVVAGTLVTVESAYQRFARTLADERAAVRHAEQAISALQEGHVPSIELHATITPLTDAAPQGLHWVRVETIERNRHAALVALAREAR